MPIDDDAVGIVKWGTGAGASDFNTPADVGFAEADGWPLAYGTPGSGSEPQREVFNWQWRRMTALAVELLTHGGGLPWDSRISYLHPASVMGSDGMLYQSVQDSTNQDPTTDASNTYWQQVGITLSDADIKTAYERNANTNALTDALLTMLQGAAPLSSPAFTGAVTVPDQTAGTNNGRAANTRFVAAALAALVAAAPSALDTLNELAAALGDDANFAATVTTQLGGKASTALATATSAGLIELATAAEITAGTTGALAVTAQELHDFLAVDVQTFTSSGTWTKVAGAVTVYAQCIGAGGGGHSENSRNLTAGAGGGFGEQTWAANVLPNTVNFTVGAGGARATSWQDANDGGETSFNGVLGRGGMGATVLSSQTSLGGIGDSKIQPEGNIEGIFSGGSGVRRTNINSEQPLVDAIGNSTYGGAAGQSTDIAGRVSLYEGNGATRTSDAQAPGGGGALGGTESSHNEGARGEVRVFTYYHTFTGRPKFLEMVL